MKILTDEESIEWCKTRGLEVDCQTNYLRVYTHAKLRVFDIKKVIPQQAVYIGQILIGETKESKIEGKSDVFRGGLVWILETIVGNYPVAMKMLERIQLSYGRLVENASGYYADANEKIDAAVLVAMMLLFHWEGYYIAEDGGYMFWIDDDEAIVMAGLVGRCDDIITELKKYYEVKEVEPENHWYKFICGA